MLLTLVTRQSFSICVSAPQMKPYNTKGQLNARLRIQGCRTEEGRNEYCIWIVRFQKLVRLL